MSFLKVIRLAAYISAITWMLLSPLRAASEPSVYLACGVQAVGRPTIDQLLCIAEAIGAPNDPASRVVRHGFNSTFAEPTVEILHRLERQIPGGGKFTWNMKIELSEIDGQLLNYGPAFEALPESSAISKGPLPSQGVQGSQPAPTLAGLCPAEQRPLTSQRLQCIARVLGIGEGKNGWRIREDVKSSFVETVWTLENTIEDTPCQDYGAYLEVAVADARVLKYGLWEAHCAHGPVPKRPIARMMRQQ